MYLKNVLDFYQLENEVKRALKEQAKGKVRGSAGVAYGLPATLLDAACIASNAWDLITETTVRNAFHKAELKINLRTGMEDEILFNELTVEFAKLDIEIVAREIDEFLAIDEEDNEEYSQSILEEIDVANNEIQSVDLPGTSTPQQVEVYDEDSNDEEELVEYEGLKPMLLKTINFNSQLCSSKAVSGAGEYYDELKSTCEKFQRLLCKASAAKNHIKKRKNARLLLEKCFKKRSLKNYVHIYFCDIVLFQFFLLHRSLTFYLFFSL